MVCCGFEPCLRQLIFFCETEFLGITPCGLSEQKGGNPVGEERGGERRGRGERKTRRGEGGEKLRDGGSREKMERKAEIVPH